MLILVLTACVSCSAGGVVLPPAEIESLEKRTLEPRLLMTAGREDHGGPAPFQKFAQVTGFIG